MEIGNWLKVVVWSFVSLGFRNGGFEAWRCDFMKVFFFKDKEGTTLCIYVEAVEGFHDRTFFSSGSNLFGKKG